MSAPDLYAFATEHLGVELSPAQDALMAAIAGVPLSAEQRDIFGECTKRSSVPVNAREWALICGARSGKTTRIMAPIALHRAIHGGYVAERGVIHEIVSVAQDEPGTEAMFTSIRDYAYSTPEVATHITATTASEIAFDTGVTIVTFPSKAAVFRSRSIPVGIVDEYAHQGRRTREILTAIRRGGLIFGADRLLIRATTPWIKDGMAWSDYQALGADNPHLLVWLATTRQMNPSITEADLDAERMIDPDNFAREYLAQFIDAQGSFLAGVVIDAAVATGVREIPPERVASLRKVATVDPSGGGTDAFTVTICAWQDGNLVQCAVRGARRTGSAPLALEAFVSEAADLVKRYGCHEVVGDRYAGHWPRQAFARHGVRYIESERSRSEAYLDVASLFTTGQIAILDHPETASQFRSLEKTYHVSGQVTVDAPQGQHEDYANCVALAGAAFMTDRPRPRVRNFNDPVAIAIARVRTP